MAGGAAHEAMNRPEGIHKAYGELLERYHGTLDLVSVQGMRDLDRLIAESAIYAEVVEDLAGDEPTIVDVGSGAGLPGVIVAASLPRARVLLVERRRRRGAFLELAASRLGLVNVRVIKGDVRKVKNVCADVITAQAVAGMADVITLTRHLHRDPCFLVSRRGPDWLEELGPVRDLLQAEVSAPTEDGNDGVDAASQLEASRAARDEGTPAMSVPVERRLDHRGSLVALRLTGGPACRSSGS